MKHRHRALVPAAILFTAATLLMLAGCGSSGASSDSHTTKLTVFAAASLNKVFPQIASAFQKSHSGVRFTFSFAGSDTLTTQIEQGAPADIFAGASTKYGDELAGKSLVDTPQIFATNKLILILPAANPAHITSLKDLTKPGLKLVIGDPTVPIGTYTRKVLANLDAIYGSGYATSVLKNVVSDALEVTAVVNSVELGDADAGFVYVTDANNAGNQVKRLDLVVAAQAVASYPIAVVKGSQNATTGQQFVTFMMGAQAQALLHNAGFGPPPK